MVLFSAPLMENENPHYAVSFEDEIEDLKKCLTQENVNITFTVDILTRKFLANLNILRPEVLHYIGHGLSNSIAMEDDNAMLCLLNAKLLKEILPKGSCKDFPKLVFINSCQSNNE